MCFVNYQNKYVHQSELELSHHDSGDLLLTFLDGDRYGIKTELAKRMEQRRKAGLNKVSWWAISVLELQSKISMKSKSGPETTLSFWR